MSPGEAIELRLKGTKRPIIGRIVSIERDVLVVETEKGIEFINPKNMISVSVRRSNGIHAEPSQGTSASGGDEVSPPPASGAEDRRGQNSESPITTLNSFEQFPPLHDVLPDYSPDFDAQKTLDGDYRSDYVRALNHYKYGLKVGEPDRVKGDVGVLMRMGESLRRTDLLLCASLLAAYCGDLRNSVAAADQAVAFGSFRGRLLLAGAKSRSGENEQAWTELSSYVRGQPEDSERIEYEHVLARLGEFLDADQVTYIQGGPVANRKPQPSQPSVDKVATLEEGQSKNNIAGPRSIDATSERPSIATTRPVNELRDDKLPTRNGNTIETEALALSQGRVTRLFESRGYGLIAEDIGDVAAIYFRFTDVADFNLRHSFAAGRIHERVEFRVSREMTSVGIERRIATQVRPIGAVIVAKPLPSSKGPATNLGGRKKTTTITSRSRSHWDAARAAELRGDLQAARAEYQSEIDGVGPKRSSAIKDLAWLLNRMGFWEDAIRTLEGAAQQTPADRRVADNLRLNIYLKARRHEQARAVIARLLHQADRRQELSLTKQDVFCLVAMGHSSDALGAIEKALAKFDNDQSLRELKSRIMALDFDRDDVDLAGVQYLGLGMSPFALVHINGAPLTGLDERSRARGYYDEVDFRVVERVLNSMSGRRPRERADLSLTLAAICYNDPIAAGDAELSNLLRRYFSLMADASTSTASHKDTIRAYALEAIAVGTQEEIISDLPMLLGTYVSESDPGLRPKARLTYVVEQFKDHPEKWQSFCKHLVYYETRNSNFRDILESELRSRGVSLAWPQDHVLLLEMEHDRQRRELARMEHLKTLAVLSVVRLQELREQLKELLDDSIFELDAERIRALVRIVSDLEQYVEQIDFTDKEVSFSRGTSALRSLIEDSSRQPTLLSIGWMDGLAGVLLSLLESEHETYRANARPSLTVSNTLESDNHRLELDGAVLLSLEIDLAPGSPPIEDVRLEINEEAGLVVEDSMSLPVMRAGQSREVRVKVRPSSDQVSDRAFSVSIKVSYTCFSIRGASEEVAFAVRIDEESDFTTIANPYASYSGGNVVSNPDMFFGREELLDRIVSQVTQGPIGQCFVLYGQKRSGKSSVLSQVQQRISKPVLSVPVTLGEIDPTNANDNFLQICAEELRLALQTVHSTAGLQIESYSGELLRLDEFKRMLREVQAHLREHWGEGARVVFLVDEFTYMYEYIEEGIVGASFMRQWKALHESALISTVVVGQDSMPKFKQKYPNEFGVTHDERITYLTEEAALKLAVRPIWNDGSRYRGKALERLLRFSGRSPWFLQIMCDELVRLLNARRARLITESDVEMVVRTLVDERALPIERFDPLITAAGESVAIASRDLYLSVLSQVAALSSAGAGARIADLAEFVSGAYAGLLGDMLDRDVLKREGPDRVRISVGLFEAWLQVNRPAGIDAGSQ